MACFEKRGCLAAFVMLLACHALRAGVPVISDFSPTYGKTNTSVIITGSGFTGATAVKFNGVAAVFGISADTQISATVPTAATTGKVRVEVGAQADTSTNDFVVIGREPYVESFDPNSGNSGTTVVITGINVTNATRVLFAGTNVSSAVVGPGFNQITVAVPALANSGPITVSNAFGGFTTSSNFFVINGKPVIDNFSPSSGPTNTAVTISGLNVTNAIVVRFNGSNASFHISSIAQDQIVATVPVNATTGPISVGNIFGTNSTSSNFVVTTLSPVVDSFSPSFGATNSDVTITGLNVTNSGVVVVFSNKVAATRTGPALNQIIATVPAGAVTGPITVSNQFGSYVTPSNFVVIGSAPVIDGFSPLAGPVGTSVTISGLNFVNPATVKFGATVATSASAVSPTQIQTVVPAGATTGPITVGDQFGTNTTTTNFFLPSTISSFSPTNGPITTTVLISGQNFLGATAVKFNGVSASFTVLSNSTLQAIVPAGSSSGFITVTTPAGTFSSSTTFSIDPSSDLAIGLTATPASLFVGSNLTFTITVTNLGPDTALNVVVTDTLPAGAIFISGTASGGVTTNATQAIGQLGSITLGSTATMTVVVAPQTIGFVTNTVTVSSSRIDTNPTNNTATIVVTSLPLPFLSIRKVSDQLVELSWPAPLSNFNLQTTPALLRTNNVWTNVPTPPAIAGTNLVVTNVIGVSNQFYRLKN
jgi:uncharacterized repeat protein (TIGR01451 family)